MRNSLRTQIILPKDLRREIDKNRNGESLSEYIRKASYERLERQKRKKADLKELAEEFVGAAKGTRTKVEIEKWIREIREDREKSDERILKK